jgi:hypothetical protein
MSTGVRTAPASRRLGAPYELLLFAFVVCGLGNWIYRLALPLLVFELTGSALNTAVVYALEYAPLLLPHRRTGADHRAHPMRTGGVCGHGG